MSRVSCRDVHGEISDNAYVYAVIITWSSSYVAL